MKNDQFADALFHGGNMQLASQKFGIPVAQWIDLSTGINPFAYPVADVPAHAFQVLPYLQPEFIAAAELYYGTTDILPLAGSQALISCLPAGLRTLQNTSLVGKVLLPAIGYREHAQQWIKDGYEAVFYDSFVKTFDANAIDTLITRENIQHLVIINPNNPTGLMIDATAIHGWAHRLSQRGGMVVVDEAFIDLTPDLSLLANPLPENVIVLRSFGKFFGLAGLRLGFVSASPRLLNYFAERLGPWSVNGVAQWVATHAFNDREWQTNTRLTLVKNAMGVRQELFDRLLLDGMKAAGVSVQRIADHSLFSTYRVPKALGQYLFNQFGKHGVLLRIIAVDDACCLIRIGMLDMQNNTQVKKLQQIIQAILVQFQARSTLFQCEHPVHSVQC